MDRLLRDDPLGLWLLFAAISTSSPSYSQETLSRQNRQDSEIQRLTAGTYFSRSALHEQDTAEVLRRVLRKNPYDALTEADYVVLLEKTVKEYPESRVAHEALANALIDHAGESGPHFHRGVQELNQAAELSFNEGTVRYVQQLPYYLAITGDEEGLRKYVERAFDLTPEGPGRYSLYLYYANALALLNSPLTDGMFKRAIATRPRGQWAAYEFYTTYLRNNKQHERILEILTPEIVNEATIMREVFQTARCNALHALGRLPQARTECPSRGSNEERSPTVGGGTLSRNKTDYPHNSSLDDCRSQSGCLYHPACSSPGICVCYNAFVWNLAEIALNEAGTEPPGSQNATAWTLRNRATIASTVGCNQFPFPGATTTCTSGCPWPSNSQACDLQKKYCCLIHATGQFNRTHIPTSGIPYDVLERMRRVVDGQLADPLSGYSPAGASGCVWNRCDGSAYCSRPGGSFDPAPDGPVFWYSNVASNFQCRAVQSGIGAPGTAIVAEEMCGNSPDGTGPNGDNCYSRCSRVRTWTYSDLSCGSSCGNYSSEKRLGSGGYAYKLPAESPRFKAPGGKHFDVTMALQAGPASSVSVQLLRSDGSLLYDFGVVTVSSSTLTSFPFESYLVVAGTGDQIRIVNMGSGTVSLTKVVSYD